MKINWKDFGLMHPVALILMLALGLLTSTIAFLIPPTFESIFQFILLGIILFSYGFVLIFYFWRNKSKLKEAAPVSFIFGFSFSILIFLTMFIIEYISCMIAQIEMPVFEISDLFELIRAFVSNAIIVMIYGSIIWFAVKKLKWEKS